MNTTGGFKFVDFAGKKWLWPAQDRELLRVNSYVADLEVVLGHVDKFELCIQAGGACGVWPWFLSERFDTVLTFEPHPINFECLRFNLDGVPNVARFCAALGNSTGRKGLAIGEDGNVGTFHLVDGDQCWSRTIDSLEPHACDLIQLDVEGGEVFALLGAKETIAKYSPVIVVEDKPLVHAAGFEKLCRGYLAELGYSEVGRVHRDVVYKR